MIRLRVAGVAPGLCQARLTSAPRASRRSRSVAVTAVCGLAASAPPFILEGADGKQALVPALFEFGRDEAVVGIDRIVLPTRPSDLVARLLECKLDLTPLLGVLDLRRASMAPIAASTPRGCSRSITSAPTARSIRIPPNEMHRSPPWLN